MLLVVKYLHIWGIHDAKSVHVRQPWVIGSKYDRAILIQHGDIENDTSVKIR